MFSKETYPFRLPELPYAYHALEPFIDQRTMYFHHDKHLKTYIDNLNKALEAYPEYQTRTLEELLTRLPELPEELRTPVRNNGGGVYNHEMYFHLMAPAGQPFSTEVAEAFGGEDNWNRQMKAAGPRAIRFRLRMARPGHHRSAENHRPPKPGQSTDHRPAANPPPGRLGTRLLPETPKPPQRLHRRLVSRDQLERGGTTSERYSIVCR